MNREELNRLIHNWDLIEYEKNNAAAFLTPEEQRKRKEKENAYENMFAEIQFLSKDFFNNYELNRNRLFVDVLLDWIEQFEGKIEPLIDESELNSKKRYALILVRKAIYFNRGQIWALLEEVWDRIKVETLSLAAKQHGLPITSLLTDTNKFNEQLTGSLLVPLSDSSHFMEFRHLLPEGAHDRITVPHIDEFLLPVKLNAKDCLKELNEKYKEKNNLFIIEDFSGSGTTARKAIISIIENYHFKNLYFCPLIITDSAYDKIIGLASDAAAKGINFKIIYGLRIESDYSIIKGGKNIYWDEDEKIALQYICEKYFETHFKTNGYLYLDYNEPQPKEPAPYGFQNIGLALILYSNCPNNSLPIIWADEEGWKPLFPRHERYKKRIKHDK